MSVLGISCFIYRLKNDPTIRAAFQSRSDLAFQGFDLTEDEKTILCKGDVVALYRLGVHPLLLAPYSRYAGIPRPKYQAALAPLKGLRQLRS
jgi:hypothetical protein